MRNIFTLVLAVALTGCAYTLEGVTSEKPEFVETTSKTVEQYAECLKNAWLDSAATFTKPIPGGQRVFTQFSVEVGTAADVLEKDDQTQVKFYNPNVLTPKRYVEAARRCL